MDSQSDTNLTEYHFVDSGNMSFLEVENVRIYPKRLVFTNPFEGKQYAETIVITNVGRNPVTIRILEATSSAMRFKTNENGIFVAQGLSIHIRLRYTFSMMTIVETCSIPIFINMKRISYPIIVQLPCVFLNIEPHEINFGKVDVGPSTSTRSLKLINAGNKPARFAVDLGTNYLGLLIEPMKGIIMEGCEKTLEIEICLMHEGEFQSEFWILSEYPIPVKVYITGIHGQIVPVYRSPLCHFHLLEFPCTYYGLKSYKVILLKNLSQYNSLFHITGELERKSIHLDQIIKEEPNYKYFQASPASGRLAPLDVRSFTFIFSPTKKLLKADGCIDSFLVIMNIHKLYCSDLDPNKYKDGLFYETDYSDEDGIRSLGSIAAININNAFQFSSDFDDAYDEVHHVLPTESYFKNTIRIVLYAPVELPSVSALPDEIILKNLILKETISRVVQLQNNSKNLPIIYRYKKIAFVEVFPKTGMLKPLEKHELSICVTPESYELVETHLEFELLYHNVPNIDKTLTVIGSVTIPLFVQVNILTKLKMVVGVPVDSFEFRKPNVKPKREVYEQLLKEKALLALPDDRPFSLRPWRNSNECKTIYAGIPRLKNIIDEYQLTKLEQLLKNSNKDYYDNYIKSLTMKKKHYKTSELDYYEISIRNNKCGKMAIAPFKPKYFQADFTSLSTDQLYNIVIKPRNWIIEHVVAQSDFTNSVKITNNNDIALRIYVRPHKPANFKFPTGHRAILKAHEEISMSFTYFTNKVGIENHTLDFIINENHVFETSFSVIVDPKVLKLGWSDTTFSGSGPLYTYLDITNIFNTNINYAWEYTGDLIIEPLMGTVAAGRSLTCRISYEIGKCSMNIYEIVMKVENRKNQTVAVFIENFNFDAISFVQNLNFGDIPLAMETKKSITMNNGTSEYLPFKAVFPHLDNSINVDPTTGVIPPFGLQTFHVIVNKMKVEAFKCDLLIILAHIKKFTVCIEGNVRMPEISISPNYFRFKKMAASSFDIKCIVIKNEDKTIPALIEFSTGNYPELHYSEYVESKFIKSHEQFIIQPNTEKIFSMHLYPVHSTISSYFLPIIINSVNTSDLVKTEGRKKIANVKVHLSILPHRLIIHTWRYKFRYFPHFNYKSVTSHIITFSSFTPVKFCIRIDELQIPFSFEYIEGGTCIGYPYSLDCELNENEKISFIAKYNPKICGIFEIKMPVYVKDDLTNSLHNYLYFKGTYPKPSIIYSDKAIWFGTIPLNMTVTKKIKLELLYHNPDCNLDISTDELYVRSELPTLLVDSVNYACEVEFLFSSNENYNLSTKISVCCKCGYAAKLPCSGGAENCFFSNYAFVEYFQLGLNMEGDVIFKSSMLDSRCSLLSSNTTSQLKLVDTRNLNLDSPFPFFPTKVGAYTNYMNKVISSVEEWLYCQGFYGLAYHKIPDTISIYSEENSTLFSPFITLLTNICGEKLVRSFYFEKKHKSSLLKMLRFYGQTLQYLENAGAIFPHILPEYLLPYDDYCQFQKLINNNITIDQKQYYLLTKQCWLDLLLQLFKCFIFRRLTLDRYSVSYSIKVSSNVEGNVLSYIGAYIMYWLNRRLQNQKYILVKDKSSFEMKWLSEKQILNLDTDLADSLALCCVTIFNCPYLVKYLKEMYIPPNNSDEYLHNAFSLVRIWQMLKMGYELSPYDIVHTNSIQMAFYLTYLFDFLTNIKPKDELVISAELCQKSSANFYISNDNEESIRYNVILFDNEDEVFSVKNLTIIIKPHSRYKLCVNYHAKFLKKHKAAIVLSGEAKGRRSVYSKAFTVVGYPTFEKPSKQIIIKSPLYIAKPFSIEIIVPYMVSTEYELFYTDNITDIENLQLTPYQTFIQENIITAICLDSHIIKTDKKGLGTISGRVCSITTNESMVYGFGRNAIYGDFYITIIVQHERSKLDTIINIDMPKAFADCTCICKSVQYPNIKCPRNVKVKVPSRNDYMWKALMRHMLFKVDQSEWTFWESQQDTLLCANMVKRILNDHKRFMGVDMQYIFKGKVQYYIRSSTKQVVFPKSFVISNTDAASETTDMVVHLNTNVEKIEFELESIDQLEIRVYHVCIKYI